MKIKFRGINKRGDVVFGAGVKTTEYDYDILLQNPKECELIQKNTAAQFVGYDADGNEFYSDDRVFDLNGNERIVADILIKFNSIGGHFDNVILKEN